MPTVFNNLLKWLDFSFIDIDPVYIIRVVCVSKSILYKIVIKGLDQKAFEISYMDWWSQGYLNWRMTKLSDLKVCQ